jgi:hypothetical protein
MFIYGTYFGIASCLFSALVCWLCFLWRRRFSTPTFTVCGTLAFFAFLWSAVVTFAASRLSSGAFVTALYHHWRESGSVVTVETIQHRIDASNSSLIISNATLSFIVTLVAGLIAVTAFGRAAKSARPRVQSQ